MYAGHGDRSRHPARGAEKSNGGWQVDGRGELQVDDVLRWEKMWVGSNIKRAVRRLQMLMMEGRYGEE